MRTKPQRPSASLIVSLLALFVALGGPAEAAKLIDASKGVKPRSITGKLIKPGSIGGDRLRDRSVETTKLTPAAVGALQLTPLNEVNGAKVADRSLGAVDIADEQLGRQQIAANGVGASEIADSSVDSGEIADGRQTIRDIAEFVGTFEANLTPVAANACVPIDVDAAEIAPVAGADESTGNDLVLVSPPPNFPDDLVVQAVSRGEAASDPVGKLTLVVCNPRAVDSADPPLGTFRYATIDF